MKCLSLKLVPLLLIATALALVGAGCGSDDANETASTTDAAMKAKETEAMKMKEEKAMKAEETMKDEKSGGAMIAANHTIKAGTVDPYGEILADDKGHSIYIFTKEQSSKSECYDECAKAWPPVLTKGAPKAGAGITESKLGTTERTDGTTQVTYDGQPLYLYVGENDKPDEVLCQGVDEFGGIWYVVAPDGTPITKS